MSAAKIPWQTLGRTVPITAMLRHHAREEVVIAQDQYLASLVFIAREGKTAVPYEKGMLLIRTDARRVHDFVDSSGSAGIFNFGLVSTEKIPGVGRTSCVKRLLSVTLGSFGTPDERFRASLAAFDGAIDGARCGLRTSLSKLEGLRSLAETSGSRLHRESAPFDAQANILFQSRLTPLFRNADPFAVAIRSRADEPHPSASQPKTDPNEVIAEVTQTLLFHPRRTELRCIADPATSRLLVSVERGAEAGVRYEKLFPDTVALSAYLLGFVEGFIAGRLADKYG